MAYERVEPAQWWRDAQATPPAPDGPGEWVATAYGWEWRRAEPDAPAVPDAPPVFVPTTPGNHRIVLTADGWKLRREGNGAGGGLIVGGESFAVSPVQRDATPPEVRVGDRVRMLHGPFALPDAEVTDVSGAAPCTVAIRQPLTPESGIADFYAVRPDEIGPAGSGKPWTLLPREAAPVELRVGDRLSHRYGSKPWVVREVFDGYARVQEQGGVTVFACLGNIGHHGADKLWTLLPRETPALACGVPDADTAAILAEGMRALDRIEARAEAEAKASGVAGSDPVFEARVQAALAALMGVDLLRSSWADAAAGALRAADAVPDPRREAERRVVELARAWCESVVAEWAKHGIGRDRVREAVGPAMGALMDALAALGGGGD